MQLSVIEISPELTTREPDTCEIRAQGDHATAHFSPRAILPMTGVCACDHMSSTVVASSIPNGHPAKHSRRSAKSDEPRKRDSAGVRDRTESRSLLYPSPLHASGGGGPLRIVLDRYGIQAKRHIEHGDRLTGLLQAIEGVGWSYAFAPEGSLSRETLEGQDVLVLTTRATTSFENSELHAIIEFVQSGGGLWIMSNHAAFRSTRLMNNLATQLERRGVHVLFCDRASSV